MSRDEDRLVYSSATGSVAPKPGRKGRKGKKTDAPGPSFPDDGFVRIRRETSGRHGKTVTTVHGLPGSEADRKEIASELKQRCGTGGSSKNGVVEIQGDHRETLREALEAEGFKVKFAGG